MSKILNIPQDNYRIKVQESGTITLDTGTNIGTINVLGVLSVNGTTNYETLVVSDDHIPNKKYVDDTGVFYPSSFFDDTPITDQVMISVIIVSPRVIFPQNFVDSQGYVKVQPTAQTDFKIQKNGIDIGLMTFTPGSNTATFSSSSISTFVTGDRLEIIAPTEPDPTLSRISISLSGFRTLIS